MTFIYIEPLSPQQWWTVLYISNQTSAFQEVSSALGLLLYTVATMPDVFIKLRERQRLTP